ncbi:hypothetical protein ACFCWD_18985 [Streptomyces sp. NPDC056374]|uniref:hypothetical protein n=1 Tax=unclassified Streptomyces TaxID=2593676 RepID=UPI0035E3A783
MYPGRGDGTIGSPTGLNGALGNVLPSTAHLVSLGDMTGDAYPDLVANHNGDLWLYAGDPARKPGVKPAVKSRLRVELTHSVTARDTAPAVGQQPTALS